MTIQTSCVPRVEFNGLGMTLTDGFEREHSLDIMNGELDPSPDPIWSIIGESGSGKTTMVRLLGLLDHPHRGSLTWHLPDEAPLCVAAGQGDASFHRRRLDIFRRHFGFAFQHAPLQPQLTVFDNLCLWRRLAGKPVLTEAEMVGIAAPLFGTEQRVANLLRCYPFEALSMGEKQRFVLLQAMAHDPSVLFVDEPTANLDFQSAEKVKDFITNWATEAGSRRLVLWVTHMRAGDLPDPPYVLVANNHAKIKIAPRNCASRVKDDAGLEVAE